MRTKFLPSFLWGAATAAYQVEGAHDEDGKGPSIWDTFSHSPWRVTNGDTGDVACDHYHRMAEDVLLMKELGLKAYRFSISWPRIQPKGKGPVNDKGLDFYKRLVDALLDAGIKPFATLYHWDLPQALEDKGGWTNRDVADYFADYATIAFNALGDRVDGWFTLNEPICTAFLGYKDGVFAPGRNCLTDALMASHVQLLAHGKAVAAFRAAKTSCGRIGIVLDMADVQAASKHPSDIAAADRDDAFHNRLYADPIFGKGYPSVLVDWIGKEWPKIPNGDMKIISAPIDLLGLNYYSGRLVSANPQSDFLKTSSKALEAEGTVKTDMGWGVWPNGLYRLLIRIKKQYADIPIYVTENGMANRDEVDEKGEVPDDARIDYLSRHFAAAAKASKDGVKLEGYFVWSLLDNFEWACGYTKRFGLVYVNYKTGQRILKKSARWYARVIADNGFTT